MKSTDYTWSDFLKQVQDLSKEYAFEACDAVLVFSLGIDKYKCEVLVDCENCDKRHNCADAEAEAKDKAE